ncbi:MAG: hypothetical protein E7582_03215 [Ruminococcaceae bacterium]|nr:hypothetical protein [Oscillospiraceae bacterium]
MGFSLIFWGLIFLLSPDVATFDFLPDFLGWIMIALGLDKLGELEERLFDAKKLAKRMIGFSIVKVVFSFFTFTMGTSDMLLVTFSYMIFEVLTVFSFASNLLIGLDYLAVRLDAPLNSDRINMAKWYLYVFFALKNALMVLPTTVTFLDSKTTGNYSEDTWFIDFEGAMHVFMIFAFLLSVVITIVMLSFFIPFFREIKKNTLLQEKTLLSYKETVLNSKSRMLKKNSSVVLTLFAFGILFFCDLYVDYLDVLPTFIGFVLISVGGIFANKKLGQKTIPLTLVSCVGAVLSLANFLYRLLPMAKNKFVFDYTFAEKPLSIVLSFLSAVSLIITIFLLVKTLSYMNKAYLKDPLQDSLFLYSLGGVVLGFFAFFLYSFPSLNTTFVFPSAIFGVTFIALFINYVIKLKKQISTDNKE